MSLVQTMPDRRPSPGPSLNLGSNNPFRRNISPNPSPNSATFDKSALIDTNDRSMSRNPFLDPPTAASSKPAQDAATSRLADDIFKDFTSSDKSASNGPASQSRGPPPRSGTVQHRHSRSRDDDDSRRHGGQPRGPPRPRQAGERNVFDSPDKTDVRRPRRNSESSVMDKDRHEEEDQKRRERRREREARREKEGRSKDTKSSRPMKKPGGLDVIDKLDVTGIYGQGLFHHDGPFDACNPHRNRKQNHRAPMHAFPANSANNALGGAAPKTFDYDKFHGRGEEGFSDFASSGQDYTTEPQRLRHVGGKNTAIINPTDRVEMVHGEESYGLGTSTFLEGAPASRSAVQRRESENEIPTALNGGGGGGGGNAGGLGRKKSLAMRIRGISQPRRPGEASAQRVTSPDAQYDVRSPDYSPPSRGAQSAGGPLRMYTKAQETNPFFNENSNNQIPEKKGATIRIAEPTGGRPRAPSSPKPYGLTRSLTSDNTSSGGGDDGEVRSGGGFLSRMKSLKGGKRTRPDIRA